MKEGESGLARNHVKFGNRRITLPASRLARIGIGIGLMVAGVLGFLPVLGFWMIPLGLLVLSIDIPMVRRWRRRALATMERWRRNRKNGAAPRSPEDPEGSRD